MKFDFDEYSFKDQIELMNINNQMKQNQLQNNQNMGFNNDILYNFIEQDKNNKKIIPIETYRLAFYILGLQTLY